MMGAQNMYIYIFMLLVLCSGLYMLLSKSDRNKRLPLIPVMTAAYVITIFIIRGGVYCYQCQELFLKLYFHKNKTAYLCDFTNVFYTNFFNLS